MTTDKDREIGELRVERIPHSIGARCHPHSILPCLPDCPRCIAEELRAAVSRLEALFKNECLLNREARVELERLKQPMACGHGTTGIEQWFTRHCPVCAEIGRSAGGAKTDSLSRQHSDLAEKRRVAERVREACASVSSPICAQVIRALDLTPLLEEPTK